MGLRPCAACHRKFIGRAQWVYVTIMLGPDEHRVKGPLCQADFDISIAWLMERAERVPEDGLTYIDAAELGKCFSCKEDADDGFALFATDYANKGDRRDWFSRMCKACALGAASILDDGPPGWRQMAL